MPAGRAEVVFTVEFAVIAVAVTAAVMLAVGITVMLPTATELENRGVALPDGLLVNELLLPPHAPSEVASNTTRIDLSIFLPSFESHSSTHLELRGVLFRPFQQ
jgi:hypothetical protein